MKLNVVFEVGQWEETLYHWVFNGKNGESKIILVYENISFVGFVEKIYSKIGKIRDTFDVPLSYLLDLNEKTSPIFIRMDEDFEIYFQHRNDGIYKFPLKVIVILEGDSVNEDSDETMMRPRIIREIYLYMMVEMNSTTPVRCRLFSDHQNDVATSRTKFPVYRNVEPVGIEFGCGGDSQAA